MRVLTLLAPGMACMLATVGAYAHHAFATEFDVNRQVELQGKVVKVELINPHSWIHVETKGPDGKVDQWAVEGAAPNAPCSPLVAYAQPRRNVCHSPSMDTE